MKTRQALTASGFVQWSFRANMWLYRSNLGLQISLGPTGWMPNKLRTCSTLSGCPLKTDWVEVTRCIIKDLIGHHAYLKQLTMRSGRSLRRSQRRILKKRNIEARGTCWLFGGPRLSRWCDWLIHELNWHSMAHDNFLWCHGLEAIAIRRPYSPTRSIYWRSVVQLRCCLLPTATGQMTASEADCRPRSERIGPQILFVGLAPRKFSTITSQQKICCMYQLLENIVHQLPSTKPGAYWNVLPNLCRPSCLRCFDFCHVTPAAADIFSSHWNILLLVFCPCLFSDVAMCGMAAWAIQPFALVQMSNVMHPCQLEGIESSLNLRKTPFVHDI